MRWKKEQKYIKERARSERLISYVERAQIKPLLLPYVRIRLLPSTTRSLASYFGRPARIPFHLKFFQGNEAHYPEGATISIMSSTSSKAESLPSSNWMNL